MTSKVFALDTKPGIQRDGTVFDKEFYNDGQWVRFQRGRPRKMLGYRQITNQMSGPSRGIWVNSQNNFTSIFSGYNNGGAAVTVEWVRMSPYAASGTFRSRVFDSGRTSTWMKPTRG